MQYSKLLDRLQKLMGFAPTQANLSKILEISPSAMANRASRNSNFTDCELEKIERQYGVKLLGYNEDCVELDYYPEVFASCGNGSLALSETKEKISLPKDKFINFDKNKNYSVITAVGDSMIPYIYDKDKLIVEHCENEQIKDNRVYVFAYNNEIFVKRLIKNIDEIIVNSDNSDPIYRPRYIEKEDMNNLKIIGQIIGVLRDIR